MEPLPNSYTSMNPRIIARNLKVKYMKYVISMIVLTALAISACGTSENPGPLSTPFSNTPTPTMQISSWNTYTNPTYGYSLKYPDFYPIVVESDEYIEIGDKVVISVWNMDPTVPRGDGPVIESTQEVHLSGYSAQLLTGYIGSIGGYIPQQYRRYVIEQKNAYLIVTLFALGLNATEGDVTQIVQLNPEDVTLFDKIVASMQIP